MVEEGFTSDDSKGNMYRQHKESITDADAGKEGVTEQQFLDAELANGISLDNPRLRRSRQGHRSPDA